MPKIIKNGLVYSGVPDEVVTAWETQDVQDIDEPTMGDTDISGIGDGSVTGAIGSLNGSLTQLKLSVQQIENISITVDGGAGLWKTVNAPTGAVAVTGYYLGSGALTMQSVTYDPSGRQANLFIRNLTASQVQTTISVEFLIQPYA